jgi:hypothetical protein
MYGIKINLQSKYYFLTRVLVLVNLNDFEYN